MLSDFYEPGVYQPGLFEQEAPQPNSPERNNSPERKTALSEKQPATDVDAG